MPAPAQTPAPAPAPAPAQTMAPVRPVAPATPRPAEPQPEPSWLEQPPGATIAAEVQDVVHEADDIRAAARRMAERSAALGSLDDHRPAWIEQAGLAPERPMAPAVAQAAQPREAAKLLRQPGSRAQAVVLAEVLGLPRALRPYRSSRDGWRR